MSDPGGCRQAVARQFRIPMRGYETAAVIANDAEVEFRIPMRGYEVHRAMQPAIRHKVLNPHEGL